MVQASKFWILASSILLAAIVSSYFLVVSTTQVYQSLEEEISPVATKVDAPILPPPVYFVGDIMLGRFVETLVARDQIQPYDFIRLFASSTAVVVNFESAIALPHQPTPSGGMQFSTALVSLEVLEQLGVTHASLANNHARDYGLLGYQNAVRELSERGIVPFGDAARVDTTSLSYIQYGTETIGLIGLHTLFVTPTATALRPLFDELSASSTIQIAYVHWGEEYVLTHSDSQRDFATLLADLGVDIIIGHHPHVTQDIEMIGKVPVFYSLGNFIFDQYFSADVQEGLVLGLTVTPTDFVFDLSPHYQCAKSTPCLMDETRRAEYLTLLAARSHPSLAEQIMAQKLAIPR